MRDNSFPTREQVESLRKLYPSGSRIKLFEMANDLHPVEPGMTGTVAVVDDAGGIHVNWDNGRHLAVYAGVDSFTSIAVEPPVKEKADSSKKRKRRGDLDRG